MDPNYMDLRDMEKIKQLMQQERQKATEQAMYDEVMITKAPDMTRIQSAKQNASGDVEITITVLKEAFNSERIFQQALHHAVQESIQRIGSVILNERRAEIEAAFNAEDLREIFAAEFARQFMASKLGGDYNVFDAMKKPAPMPFGGGMPVGGSAGPLQTASKTP